jgi:hypothetical protein
MSVLIHARLLLVVSMLSMALAQAQRASAVIPSMLNSVSEERIKATVERLADAGGWKSRVNFTPGNDSAREYIEREFRSLPGLVTTRDSFYVPASSPFNQQPLMNVAAVLPRTNSSTEVIVVGAHYDSQAGRQAGWDSLWQVMPAPGADDNASGVAAVIEIARVLSGRQAELGSHGEVHFVAFAGEEGTTPGLASYLNGSRNYANGLRAKGANVVAVINMDMLGFNPLFRYATIVADSQSQWLGKYLYEKNIEYGLGFIIDTPPFRANRWSDHAPFWDAGYPAVLLIENFSVVNANAYFPGNSSYHRSSDTVGNLTIALISDFTQWALSAVVGLTMNDRSMDSTDANEFSLRVFPNPSEAAVTVQFFLRRSGNVTIALYDILGREIEMWREGILPSGYAQRSYQLPKISSGMYLLRVESPDGGFARKLIIRSSP